MSMPRHIDFEKTEKFLKEFSNEVKFSEKLKEKIKFIPEGINGYEEQQLSIEFFSRKDTIFIRFNVFSSDFSQKALKKLPYSLEKEKNQFPENKYFVNVVSQTAIKELDFPRSEVKINKLRSINPTYPNLQYQIAITYLLPKEPLMALYWLGCLSNFLECTPFSQIYFVRDVAYSSLFNDFNFNSLLLEDYGFYIKTNSVEEHINLLIDSILRIHNANYAAAQEAIQSMKKTYNSLLKMDYDAHIKAFTIPIQPTDDLPLAIKTTRKKLEAPINHATPKREASSYFPNMGMLLAKFALCCAPQSENDRNEKKPLIENREKDFKIN